MDTKTGHIESARVKSHGEILKPIDAAVIDSIRGDFPTLHQRVHGHPLAYLDNAATSQKPHAVLEAIEMYYSRDNSNVHRGVHTLSQRATDAYELARKQIAEFIGAGSTREIIFTRGTTESINLVASSLGGMILQPGDEILISAMEHHSNIVPWQLICSKMGATLQVANVTEQGELDIQDFRSKLSKKTKLVAITHVSNSLGTINPVEQIIADAHALNIPVLLDGAQAVPHLQVDVKDLGADFYCLSSHKLFGPTGFGILYGKESILDRMPPYQGGGDMIDQVDFSGTTFNELPHKFEAGTPHIEGAIGFAAALQYVEKIGFDVIQRQEADLLDYATKGLSSISGLRIVGQAQEKASVLSFLVGKSHPYDVGSILDRFGIAVRTGHHCTQPLMKLLGVPGTVRASLAFYNTRSEVDRLVEAVEQAGTMLA